MKTKNISVMLAGNPNVGKSTVFNMLTGLRQHTGNWAGKTVSTAEGEYSFGKNKYTITDLPGTYSLIPHSAEEEVARDIIYFAESDAVVVVCDATCPERNLNLALQILEIKSNVVLAINLIDEAEKKGICIDTERLQELLGIFVVPIAARSRRGLNSLITAIEKTALLNNPHAFEMCYSKKIEQEITVLSSFISKNNPDAKDYRKIALKLLVNDSAFAEKISKKLDIDLSGIAINRYISDEIASELILTAENLSKQCITNCRDYHKFDKKIDRFVIGRFSSLPIMLVFMLAIFWITISGANYPSQLLSVFFAWLGEIIRPFVFTLPEKIAGLLFDGVYNVLTWVVAVMLPPMAIFFPLFTLLEDAGFLPRIAFNLDGLFKKAGACGKQALTMAMGFGCNACGVTGTRIIDSPRERLIAIITNSLVPCNGRLPMLAAISAVFITGAGQSSFSSALILTSFILFGVIMTLLVSKLLTITVLKGVPSSFTLELPPYRKPQFGKVIIRSIFDRTIFVLGRAATVAIPAGAVIWLLANIYVNDVQLLNYCADFLEPFGNLLGMDGVIILAFLLGFPASEIVLPLIIMCYMSQGTLSEIGEIGSILTTNGWTATTAICVMLFTLFHFPCSTTCITAYKETKSLKWTAAVFFVPLTVGIILCFTFNMFVILIF